MCVRAEAIHRERYSISLVEKTSNESGKSLLPQNTRILISKWNNGTPTSMQRSVKVRLATIDSRSSKFDDYHSAVKIRAFPHSALRLGFTFVLAGVNGEAVRSKKGNNSYQLPM